MPRELFEDAPPESRSLRSHRGIPGCASADVAQLTESRFKRGGVRAARSFYPLSSVASAEIDGANAYAAPELIAKRFGDAHVRWMLS